MNSSHAAQRNENSSDASPESLILADAFAEFIAASSRLETFYGDLQKEVSQLGQELTERNAALHARLTQSEESNRTLRHVLEALPCAVVVVEESGSLSFLNAEAALLLEQDSSLPIRADLVAVMYECATDRQERDFIFHTGVIHRVITLRSRHLRQDEHAGSCPVGGPIVAVLRDITLQRKVEEERTQRHKTAALAGIVADVAREIRSPLANIELFTNLIEKEKGDPSRWIAHLRTSTSALAETLNQAMQL